MKPPVLLPCPRSLKLCPGTLRLPDQHGIPRFTAVCSNSAPNTDNVQQLAPTTDTSALDCFLLRITTPGANQTINEGDDRNKSKAMMATQSARQVAEVAVGKLDPDFQVPQGKDVAMTILR